MHPGTGSKLSTTKRAIRVAVAALICTLTFALALALSTATAITPGAEAATRAELRAALRRSTLKEISCAADIAFGRSSCWVASIPENVTKTNSALIRIHIVRVNEGAGDTPVVFLQGGPGLASSTFTKFFARSGRDTLLIDVRGAGRSEPSLRCRQLSDLWPDRVSSKIRADKPITSQQTREHFKSCVDELRDSGVNLDFYNTENKAIDIELVRRLFKVEKFRLHGSSYGTRLALTYMRDFPTSVDAALLESPLPFDVDFFAGLPNSTYEAISRLDSSCDSDRGCEKAHGSFEDELNKRLLALNEDPLTVDALRPKSAAALDYHLHGAELLKIVFSNLYHTRAIESLPRQISKAEWGGYEEVVQNYVNSRDPEVFDFSTVLYWSTWCAEELRTHDPSKIDETIQMIEEVEGEALANIYRSVFTTASHQKYCDILDLTEPEPNSADTADIEPNSADTADIEISDEIAVMIFSGGFDPVTPTEWASELDESLDNSVLVEFGSQSHGLIGQCADTIRSNFLIAPHEEIDITCAQGDIAPDFD